MEKSKEKVEKEFIIWGIEKGEKYESILHTKTKSYTDAENVLNQLVSNYGTTNARIQVIDPLNLEYGWDTESIKRMINILNNKEVKIWNLKLK